MSKTFYILIAVFAALLSACNTKKQQTNHPDPPSQEDHYLGQKPPGLTPEVFAPGIVSVNGTNVGGISFSSDLNEMYFHAADEDDLLSIYFSKLEDNTWTPPKRMDFTKGRKKEEIQPFVSPDNKRIYFVALDSVLGDEKIWYANRLGDAWSDAAELDSPINEDLAFFPNQAKNGDLFYFNLSKRKTYYAPYKNGEFPEVHEAGFELGHHASISPSQDYLIASFQSNAAEGRKDSDMYVYFKGKDGTWAKPINLGNTINTSRTDVGARITPDGQYLFFGRDGNMYWVSTAAIEQLRP